MGIAVGVADAVVVSVAVRAAVSVIAVADVASARVAGKVERGMFRMNQALLQKGYEQSGSRSRSKLWSTAESMSWSQSLSWPPPLPLTCP